MAKQHDTALLKSTNEITSISSKLERVRRLASIVDAYLRIYPGTRLEDTPYYSWYHAAYRHKANLSQEALDNLATSCTPAQLKHLNNALSNKEVLCAIELGHITLSELAHYSDTQLQHFIKANHSSLERIQLEQMLIYKLPEFNPTPLSHKAIEEQLCLLSKEQLQSLIDVLDQPALKQEFTNLFPVLPQFKEVESLLAIKNNGIANNISLVQLAPTAAALEDFNARFNQATPAQRQNFYKRLTSPTIMNLGLRHAIQLSTILETTDEQLQFVTETKLRAVQETEVAKYFPDADVHSYSKEDLTLLVQRGRIEVFRDGFKKHHFTLDDVITMDINKPATLAKRLDYLEQVETKGADAPLEGYNDFALTRLFNALYESTTAQKTNFIDFLRQASPAEKLAYLDRVEKRFYSPALSLTTPPTLLTPTAAASQAFQGQQVSV